MSTSRGARHLVVVSDFHLSEPEPGSGAWHRYRQRRFFPDDDLASLVDTLIAKVGAEDRLEWVFGGDVFEFDGPVVEGGETRFEDRPRTAHEALIVLTRLFEAHRVFFDAVARLVRAGHRVVFVAGNHDAQLSFPEVAESLRAKVLARVGDVAGAARNVLVRPWFYRTVDGIHVEHGHQYDPHCAFRDPVRPVDARSGEVAATMGSLSFRHLVSRMGYFNAHDERTFMLSVPGYIAHWVRHYLFSRRSLAMVWLRGAVKIVVALLPSRPSSKERALRRQAAGESLAAYADEAQVPASDVARHARLFAEPSDSTPYRVVRELHLEQLAMAVVALFGLALAMWVPIAGFGLTLVTIVVALLHEWIAPRRLLTEDQRQVDAVARQIANVYPTRAVVFGHTHRAHASREAGVVVANSGAWTPTTEGDDAPNLDGRGVERPFVWLWSEGESASAALEGGLFSFTDGTVTPKSSCTDPRDGDGSTPAGSPLE